MGILYYLSQSFPNIIPSVSPVAESIKTLDPHGLYGFVSGGGNLFINIANSNTKIGKQVALMFTVSQHSRDVSLLRSIGDLLGCGDYYSGYFFNKKEPERKQTLL